jgi:hypothetical protein
VTVMHYYTEIFTKFLLFRKGISENILNVSVWQLSITERTTASI